MSGNEICKKKTKKRKKRKNEKMKTITKLTVIGFALATMAAGTAQASLNFSQINGDGIQFNGGSPSTFQLNPTSGGSQFQFNGSSLVGWITGGPWTIGSVTTVGNVQSASVTTGGTLYIQDASNVDLSGNLTWGTIKTVDNAGSINSTVSVNITGISYSGLNSDLIALKNGVNGSLVLTFQFTGETLSQLTAPGAVSEVNTYSGSISSVPEPSTVIAGALLLLPFGVSSIRALRKNRA
jgi:hypothetical protein